MRGAKDPRSNPRHRERGPRRFSFTYEDVARAAGVSVGTARTYACLGRYDPADLRSVAEFVLRRPKALPGRVPILKQGEQQ